MINLHLNDHDPQQFNLSTFDFTEPLSHLIHQHRQEMHILMGARMSPQEVGVSIFRKQFIDALETLSFIQGNAVERCRAGDHPTIKPKAIAGCRLQAMAFMETELMADLSLYCMGMMGHTEFILRLKAYTRDGTLLLGLHHSLRHSEAAKALTGDLHRLMTTCLREVNQRTR